MQATRQIYRGEFLFAVLLLLLLLLSLAPLHAQPAATNRVLDLDGTSGYVELPPNIFNHLEAATVEGWIKWRRFVHFSRFFDSGMTGRSFDLTQLGAKGELDLAFEIYAAAPEGDHGILAANVLRTNQWLHIAAVSGKGGMKLYLNGHLLGQDPYEGSFRAVNHGESVRLGRDAWGGLDYTDGQMAEVRVWSQARTETQIRDNMFNRLTGQEPGLAGLWNFADGAANDASPGAHHGKLMGQAKVTEAALPAANTLVPWSRLVGRVTDARGSAVPNVTIRADANGAEIARGMTGSQGKYALTLWTGAQAVDLAAAGSNDVGGLQFAVPISPYAKRTNDWVLKRSIHLAGKVLALDGKTPHAALVVELVQPESDRSGELDSKSKIQNPKPEIDQGLLSSAGTTNQVLQLDGEGSYVELPPDLFTGLAEATVEGWARWQHLGVSMHVFDFGDDKHQLTFQNGETTGDLDLYIKRAGEGESFKMSGVKRNQWHHLAVVASASSLTLYLDGLTVGGGPYTGGFSSIAGGKLNFLGGCILRAGPDFHGQMDEVRVWRNARTAEQIRATMSQKLTGNEPGLFCLWNFDDPSQPGRDATPGAHHGKLIGQAAVTNMPLPVMVFGKITDAADKALPGAKVHVTQVGREDLSFTVNEAGEYAFTTNPSERCDVFVSNGELSAYRLGFQPTAEPQQRLDWTLTDPEKTAVVLGLGSTGASPVPPGAPPGGTNATAAASISISTNASAAVPVGEGADRSGRGARAPQFPAGAVVDTVVTDEQGNFKFPNVKPGVYQVRAHIPGGRAWLDAGRVLYVNPEASDAERARLANLDFRLAPFIHGHWKRFGVADGLPSAQVFRVMFAQDGAAWFATSGGISRFDGYEFSNLTRTEGLPTVAALGVAQTRDGDVWFACGLGGLVRYVPADSASPARAAAVSEPSLMRYDLELRSTPDGALWGRRFRDVVRYEGKQETVFTNVYPFSGYYYGAHFAVAPDGRVWFTGIGAGLVRFDGTNMIRLTPKDGLLSMDTGGLSVAPDGAVWFGDGPGTLTRYDGTNFTHFTTRDGVPSGDIVAIHVTPGGSVWLTTADGPPCRYDGRGFIHFTEQGRVKASGFLEIETGPDGATWFATRTGAYRYEEDALALFSIAHGLPKVQTVATNHWESPKLLSTRDGKLYLGSGTNGLVRFDGKKFEVFDDKNSLPGGYVSDLVQATDGLLWVTTSNAIVRFDGNRFLPSLTNLHLPFIGSRAGLAQARDGAI